MAVGHRLLEPPAGGQANYNFSFLISVYGIIIILF